MKPQVLMLGVEEGIKAFTPIVTKYADLVKDVDNASFTIIVGGDGTILDEHIKWLATKRPVLKVHYSNNVKSLGYTCDVNAENLEQALQDLIEGKYRYENVGLLRYTITSENGCSIQTGLCLNDVAVENVVRASTILANMVVTDYEDMDYRETLPIAKCTGLLITGNHGSSAWNLALNGAVVVAENQEHILLDIRESPLKPDKFILAGTAILTVTPYSNCIVKIDREDFEMKKNDTLKVEVDRTVIRFIKTTNTKETLLEKFLRFNKFQNELL